MKRIAITGATGGLGRSACEFFLKRGYEVKAFGRNTSIGSQLQTEFAAKDVTDLRTGDFEGVDVVIHSAGLAAPFGPWREFEHANVEGTRATLAASKSVPLFIHISTPSIYFNGKDRLAVREDDPLPPPANFYSKSKLLADELVLQARRPSVLLRPRAIIGPHDRTIVPRMVRLMSKGFFPLPNGGHSLIDLTAVENVAHAMELVIKSSETFQGEIFNITNMEPRPLIDLAKDLARIYGLSPRFISIPMPALKIAASLSELLAGRREPMISKYAVESIGTTQVLSVEKAVQRLGYRPLVSLEDALAKIAQAGLH